MLSKHVQHKCKFVYIVEEGVDVCISNYHNEDDRNLYYNNSSQSKPFQLNKEKGILDLCFFIKSPSAH